MMRLRHRIENLLYCTERPAMLASHSQPIFSAAPHQTEENGATLRRLDPTLVFYAKPLLGRWVKSTRQPVIGIVSPISHDVRPWQKAFRTEHVTVGSPETMSWPVESVDLLVWLCGDEDVSAETLQQVTLCLKKGGGLIWVTPNAHVSANQDIVALEALGLVDVYPVGFHPHGAVAWWPITSGLGVWLGHLVEFIWCFFPGRYQMGLRFGRLWMRRALKRDDQTVL